MRIEHNSLAAFIAEIESGVYQDTVRVRLDKTPEQPEAQTFHVGAWFTALSRDAEWIIELGIVYGLSRKGALERFEADEKMLQEACEKVGIKILPGKIERY